MPSIEVYSKHRRFEDENLSDWEIDEFGNLANIYFKRKELFRPSFEAGMEKLINWIENECDDDWFWDWEETPKLLSTNEVRRVLVREDLVFFYFKNYNDALAFKIVWGGNSDVVYT